MKLSYYKIILFSVVVLFVTGFTSLISESFAEVNKVIHHIHLADSVEGSDVSPISISEIPLSSSILNDYHTYKITEHEINTEPFLDIRNSFAGEIGE